MPTHKGSIVTPTEFSGRETVSEEKAEERAIKRSGGDVKKAMKATSERKMRGGRKVSR